MHTLRLDYAVGKFDDAPDRLEAMKTVLPIKDGKHFYEVLDDAQIAELAACFCMGDDYIDAKERASVVEKFPDVDWKKFTYEAFVGGLQTLKKENSEFAKAVEKALKHDTSDSSWDEVTGFRHGEIPVGLVLKLTIEDARKGLANDDD